MATDHELLAKSVNLAFSGYVGNAVITIASSAAIALASSLVLAIFWWVPKKIKSIEQRIDDLEKSAITQATLDKILDTRIFKPLDNISETLAEIARKLGEIEKEYIKSEINVKELTGTVHGFYRKLDAMGKEFSSLKTQTHVLEAIHNYRTSQKN